MKNTTNKLGLNLASDYGDYRLPESQGLNASGTVAIIKEMGLSATFKHGEFRVTFPEAVIRIKHPDWTRSEVLHRMEEVAYYTNDSTDALETARQMRGQEYKL